jgi:hypothetical protein
MSGGEGDGSGTKEQGKDNTSLVVATTSPLSDVSRKRFPVEEIRLSLAVVKIAAE